MKVADPGLFALKNAVRAALVTPLAFALGLAVLDSEQLALFAAFGSMALLVFVDFGGPWRYRLRAFALLALAGALLIALGTLCSRSAVAATLAMAAVGFAAIFAGALNVYVAAAQSAVVLSFVLAATVPAGPDEIPARLAGWGLAAALSTAAALLLFPRRPRGALREGVAAAMRAIADLAEVSAARRAGAEAERAARAAIDEVRARFVLTPYLPSGSGGRTAALARLIEDLGWLRAFAVRQAGTAEDAAGFAVERDRVQALVPVVLRGAAERLVGAGSPQRAEAELAELRGAHDRLGQALLARFRRLRPGEERQAASQLDEAYRVRMLALATAEAAAQAARAAEPRPGAPRAAARARLDQTGRLARAHASMRSVWLRNSLRGALGLSLAVLVAQLTAVEHGFWVVLGTMSVLRSNALATGTSIVSALLGTLAGILVGGLLVELVDDSRAALWAALPPAALLAAYAPRAVSFAAGQAGFSVVVLILFNLLQPAGWEVGLIRIEDVAMGAAVSLAVGLLLWPRGAATVLRRALADAYERAASYLDATIEALLGRPAGLEAAHRDAYAAGQVLEATVRDYLAERSSARDSIQDLAVLAAGATRVRRVARLLQHVHGLAPLRPLDSDLESLREAWRRFEAERDRRCAWYAAFGEALGAERAAPEPEPPAAAAAGLVLDGADGGVPPGLAIDWSRRYLEMLREMEPAIVRAAR